MSSPPPPPPFLRCACPKPRLMKLRHLQHSTRVRSRARLRHPIPPLLHLKSPSCRVAKKKKKNSAWPQRGQRASSSPWHCKSSNISTNTYISSRCGAIWVLVPVSVGGCAHPRARSSHSRWGCHLPGDPSTHSTLLGCGGCVSEHRLRTWQWTQRSNRSLHR
jgi:hypothetical protein